MPGVAIVALKGEHETYTAPDIERAIFAALDEEQAVIVDLSQTEFLDSSVVSVLLRAREAAAKRGRRFGLVVDDTTGGAVRQLLEMTGLSAIFPISQSRDDAIAGAA